MDKWIWIWTYECSFRMRTSICMHALGISMYFDHFFVGTIKIFSIIFCNLFPSWWPCDDIVSKQRYRLGIDPIIEPVLNFFSTWKSLSQLSHAVSSWISGDPPEHFGCGGTASIRAPTVYPWQLLPSVTERCAFVQCYCLSFFIAQFVQLTSVNVCSKVVIHYILLIPSHAQHNYMVMGIPRRCR